MLDVKGMDPITSHQAAIYMNDVHQTNCTGFTFKATIDTKESRVIGQQATKPRIRAVKYSGDIKFYKRSPWLLEYVKYLQTHQYYLPFDLIGLVDDEGSDFYRLFGTQTINLENCVLNGDLTLMQSDTNCEDVEESVTFLAERLAA